MFSSLSSEMTKKARRRRGVGPAKTVALDGGGESGSPGTDRTTSEEKHKKKIIYTNAFWVMLVTIVVVVLVVFTNDMFLNADTDHLENSSKLPTEIVDVVHAVGGNKTQDETSRSNSTSMRKIPRHIVILDTRYETIHDIPSPHQQNVQHTIYTYVNSWKKEAEEEGYHEAYDDEKNKKKSKFIAYYDKIKALLDSPYVWYLNDEQCQQSITAAKPQLLPYYLKERSGKNKANICRIAALYLKGGYYFDTDMQIIKPVTIEPHITFVSPFGAEQNGLKYVFNSFIAVAPGHPLLRHNLGVLLRYYKRKSGQFDLLGSGSLFYSLKEYTKISAATAQTIARGMVPYNNTEHNQSSDKMEWPLDFSLAESHFIDNDNYHPKHYRLSAQGCCCHYVVQNVQEKEIYFYSRIVGAGDLCVYKDKIPHRLVFVDTRYDSIESLPSPLQENVKNTVQVYKELWEKERAQHKVDHSVHKRTSFPVLEIDYLGNKECLDVIQRVETRLVPYYLKEGDGQNKDYICRVAALYKNGGYYFNTDLQVVKALDIQSHMTLAVVRSEEKTKSQSNDEQAGFVNSFVAVMREHPLLRINMDILIQHYEIGGGGLRPSSGYQFPGQFGAASFFAAYKDFVGKNDGEDSNEEGLKRGFRTSDWPMDLSLNESNLLGGV